MPGLMGELAAVLAPGKCSLIVHKATSPVWPWLWDAGRNHMSHADSFPQAGLPWA